MVFIIITILTFAGAICGVLGLGEKECICKYNYTEEENK